MKRKKKSRVSKKISILRGEGVKQDQAVAESLEMNRKHRLTKDGGYIRSKKRGKRRGRR